MKNTLNANSIILTILLVWFFNLSIFSQANHPLDKIYLKNGKVVQGVIQKKELGVVSVLLLDSVTLQEKVQQYQQADILKIAHNTLKLQQKADQEIKSNVEYKSGLSQTKESISNSKSVQSDVANPLLNDDQKSNIITRPEKLPTSRIIEMPNFPQTGAVSEKELTAAPADLSELNKTPESKRYHKGWYRQIKGFRMFLEYGYMVGVGQTKNNKMEFLSSLGYQFNPIFYLGIGVGGALS